jgi:Na+/melibiose symporter-like transporter
VALAVCFALLFAGPPLGSTALDTAYVVLLFLACATAYAFFQVPFVAMPAEITDSYDERTRLQPVSPQTGCGACCRSGWRR